MKTLVEEYGQVTVSVIVASVVMSVLVYAWDAFAHILIMFCRSLGGTPIG